MRGFMTAQLFALFALGGLARQTPRGTAWLCRREVWSEEAHADKVAAAKAKRERKGALRLRNQARSDAGYHPALAVRCYGGARA